MTASYSVDVDPARDFVLIRARGFLSATDLAGAHALRAEAHRRLRCAPNRHVTLVDVRELSIQSQEVVAAFGRLLHDPAWISRRLALVTGSALMRLQLLRAVADRPDVRVFDDAVEAEAWLFDARAEAA